MLNSKEIFQFSLNMTAILVIYQPRRQIKQIINISTAKLPTALGALSIPCKIKCKSPCVV